MKRRSFLASSAAVLAAPAIGGAEAAKPVRFVPDADLAFLDPVATTSYQTRDHGFMVYDTLYGQDDSYAVRPQMAEGHTVEADGKTWNIKLRDGLKFHDGEKVLARDAAASIARWGKRDSFGQSLMAQVEEIAAADDRTIRIRLKAPFPLLPDALAHYSPSICPIMPERIAGTDPMKPVTEMVGSGPFRFKADERVPGSLVVYEKFKDYAPRNEPASRTAGGKLVNVDRVEWKIIPDTATVANALIAGEIDWWGTPSTDLLPLLRKNRAVTLPIMVPTGTIATMRFNQMQPPFDNPAIRRAIVHAVNQADYMTAVQGEDRTMWSDGVGYFCPTMPMANDAGMAALNGPRSIDAAKRALEQAGYKGEQVVLLAPGDVPYAKILADVTADLFRRVGLNLDYQAMDWGTLVQRRAKTDPLDKGGWSVFQTNWTGPDQGNPATHVFLRGNGRQGSPGWPDMPKMEELRNAWLRATDLGVQKQIARDMQSLAFQEVPYIPLGQMISPTAHRADITGMVEGQVVFWNMRRG